MQKANIGWSLVSAILMILFLWSLGSSAGPFDTVEESMLDNGLKVLTVENHTSPTATIQVWYKVGSRNETQDVSGVSHILEHMMFKGTEKHPTGDFDRIVKMNGMENNAFTSHDFTCFYENLASDRLEVAMELEADRMHGVILPEEEFRSEMGVIRNERRQVLEDPPFARLNEQVSACVYTAHSYRWPIIGWMSVLETITSDEVRDYYNNYYRPNNATLVVVGDVTHDEVMKLAKETFGSVPRGPEVRKVNIVEPEQMGEKIVYVHKEAQLPGLIISFHAPKCDAYEVKILQVIENILFIGESSRAFRTCVYENPLALGVGGGIYFRTDPSIFSIHAMCQPGTTAETLRDSIFVLLEDLKESPVEDEELQKAKNQILADEMFAQGMNEDIAYRLGAWESRTSWKDAVNFADECLKVTAEDIQRVAREIFKAENRTVGILVPEPPEVVEAHSR